MLRASFDYARLESGMRSIMFSTFGPVDGKPAVAGNLAVALARSGRNVVLCDLDVRSPSVAGMFGVNGGAGITDVALNEARLTEALIAVPVANGDSPNGGGAAQLETLTGTLRIVPLGTLNPPSPAEFVGSSAVARRPRRAVDGRGRRPRRGAADPRGERPDRAQRERRRAHSRDDAQRPPP